jgi:hypothetical protein
MIILLCLSGARETGRRRGHAQASLAAIDRALSVDMGCLTAGDRLV